MQALWERQPEEVDFLEVAPENWIGVGGRQGRRFREFTERYPVTLHGLSLSLGRPRPWTRNSSAASAGSCTSTASRSTPST